jgi:hypothetical protein
MPELFVFDVFVPLGGFSVVILIQASPCTYRSSVGWAQDYARIRAGGEPMRFTTVSIATIAESIST